MLQEQRLQIYDRINNIKTEITEIGKDKYNRNRGYRDKSGDKQ